MTGTALRWTLAVAALTLAACGGSPQQQQKNDASAAGQPAVKVSPPQKPHVPQTHQIKITFSSKSGNVQADCSARIPQGQKKTIVGHKDSVIWALENSNNNACGSYNNGDEVSLTFDKHVFVEGDTLYAKNGMITGTIDDSTPNQTDANYTVNLRGLDAGDPDIDVNDCNTTVPPKN